MRKGALAGVLCFALSCTQLPALAEILKFDAESPIKLENSKFTISPSWTFDKETQNLQTPEGDLSIFFLQVPFTGDAEEMTKAAWKSVKKEIPYKILQKQAPPADKGWEQVHQIVYEVPVEENRSIISLIRVFQGIAYISLIDGSNAALDKRGAQFQIALDTWCPDGMKKEDLSQRKEKQFSSADEANFDKFITESMAAMNIPGTAVAIIQDGKQVYRKGFGVKLLGSSEKVTPETLFMIGSTTKPLTTLMVSKLVEQGKFSWDTPIYKVLPGFELEDKEISKQFLIKHTACACTGMPRRDMEEVFGSKIRDASDVLKQLHTMKPTTGFGETFQYSNQLVAVGGLAGAYVYGKGADLFSKYENAMSDLVFSPLQMSSTRVKPKPADSKLLASPHARGYDGKPTPISQEFENALYAIGPAGCIWSSIDDLSKYVLMELRKGKDAQGKQLFSEEQIIKRRTPGIKVDDDTKYGLGLFIENNKGATVIHHAGNTLGFSSHMIFLPKNKIGMVVLTNSSGINSFRNALLQRLLEVFLQADPKSDDMIKFAVKSYKDMNDKQQERVSLSKDETKWIGDYIGHYDNQYLGPIEIAEKDGKFLLVTPRWKSELCSSKEQTGERLLGIQSPPWWLSELRVKKESPRKIFLDDAQIKYEFVEVK